MHAGTIEWNGSDLSRIGKPKLTIRRAPDPAPPGVATRMLVSLTVTVDLEALDPGTLQARAEWLADSMRVTEGILRGSSGSGHAVEWLAAPGENNLAEVISGHSNSVNLVFSAAEPHPDAVTLALDSASFTPADSSTPLILHAVRDVKQDIKTTRHAERNGSRSATTENHAFTARFAQANAGDPLATRLSYLRAQAEIVKALDTRQGMMVLGELNSIVRVTDFTPTIDERAGTLDVQVQCYRIILPDSGTAECLYEMDSKDEEGSGEQVITLSGEIAAETRDIALAKLEILRAAQAISGQRISSYSARDKIIDGADSSASGDNWTGALSFSMEIRKALSGGHHTLRIATQKDIRSGMKWSYTGSARAASAAAALATARAIAAAASHPVMTRSEETIEQATDLFAPAGALHFVKLDFSYEFEGPSDGFIGGEISTDTATPLAGEWRRTTSGFLIGVSKAAVETRLALLLTDETNPLETTRRWSEVYHDPTGSGTVQRVAMKLDFTCGLRTVRTRATIEFTDTTQNSLAAMTQNRTVSGTLWTSGGGNADTALTAFLVAIFGAGGAPEVTRTHSQIQFAAPGTTGSVAGTTQWIKLDFSAAKTSKLTGVTGYDLLEASFTMERTGCINNTIVTPIPYGRAVAQTGTGYTPGRMSINASAKAITLSTARSWVQGKRTLASGITGAHETEQPREVCAPEYPPFLGGDGDIKLWSFSGTYGWTYTGTALDGVWSSGLPG